MRSITKNILTALLFFVVSDLIAQQLPVDTTAHNSDKIRLTTRIEKNAVILRWAPASYPLWDEGNNNGYILQRMEFNRDPFADTSLTLQGDTVYKNVTLSPIKPWTLDEWKTKITDTSDRYPGVAMELLYGDKTPPPSQGGPIGALKAMYDDQTRRLGFALLSADFSATAATGLALRYEDKNIKTGYFYMYRLLVISTDEMIQPDTAYAIVDMRQTYKPEPVKHAFTEEFNKQVAVYWTRHNDQSFSAYDVERSTDKKTWKQLNVLPFKSSDDASKGPNMLVDTLVELGKTYYYRIRGYTAFGDKGEWSEILVGKGVDMEGPAPAFNVQAEDLGDGGVLITWEAFPNEEDFSGFYVARNAFAAGEFQKISDLLPKEARTFVDFTPNPLDNNFYMVISIDKNGNETKSYVDLGYIVDSVAPEIPTGLKGNIDSTGIVTLDWNRGPEADIIGYRVYWSNNKDNEYSQLTGDLVPGINFVDSVEIKTLSEEVYYKIAAVDHRYNHSEYSEPLLLKKPDIVPPAAAVFKNYTVNENKVEMTWIKSSSDDAVKQTLERKDEAGDWKSIKEFAENTSDKYTDSSVNKNAGYEYRITVTDDANNKTYSEILAVTTFDRGVRAGVTNFTIKKESETSATLQWNFNGIGANRIIIYKTIGENTTLLAKASPDVKEFKDNSYSAGAKYGVKVLYADGGESGVVEAQ